MPAPSSIRIFLADGSPTGLRIVERSNWSGKGVVFPRSGFLGAKSRSEFERTGVYVLAGPSAETGRERIYVGEGDPVRPRLEAHAVSKDYWTQGFVFVSNSNGLNKAHVQYLEARLCELAEAAKRAELDNGNRPQRPTLSETEEADMELFLQEMLVCFPVLGLAAFERPSERAAPGPMYLVRSRGSDARGFESEDGFVVQSGSVVADTEAPSIPTFVSALRKELLASGIIRVEGTKWAMTQDYVFSSPSTAASVVQGRNANGRVDWKDESGRTLKEHQESQP